MNQLIAGASDLVFGAAMVGCALGARRAQQFRTPHRYWPATFWCGAASAFLGTTHHWIFAGNQLAADLSWVAVGIALCLSLSAMLAATATEVLSPPSARTVIRIRSVGLAGYAAFAASGHGNLGALLACESLTMFGVLVMWGYGGRAGHPQAPRIMVGIAAMAAATVAFTQPGVALGNLLHLDPGSFDHLLQIPGLILVVRALVLDPPVAARRRDYEMAEAA